MPRMKRAQRGGDALGMDQRDPLRHQFAEDQREIRDADHDHRHADRMGVAGAETRPARSGIRCSASPSVASPNVPEQHGDDRDADLHRRQQARRVALQFERGFGAGDCPAPPAAAAAPAAPRPARSRPSRKSRSAGSAAGRSTDAGSALAGPSIASPATRERVPEGVARGRARASADEAPRPGRRCRGGHPLPHCGRGSEDRLSANSIR